MPKRYQLYEREGGIRNLTGKGLDKFIADGDFGPSVSGRLRSLGIGETEMVDGTWQGNAQWSLRRLPSKVSALGLMRDWAARGRSGLSKDALKIEPDRTGRFAVVRDSDTGEQIGPMYATLDHAQRYVDRMWKKLVNGLAKG